MDRDRDQRRAARMEERVLRRRSGSPSTGLVLGAIIVLVGLLLLLSNMGVFYIHDVWRYWPLALVVLGVSRIAERRTPTAMAWGGMIALIGMLLFLDSLDIIVVDARIIWPLVIIAFGLTMLWRALDRQRFVDGVGSADASSLSLWAIFSGGKRRVESPDFRGGEVLAIFGGFEIDLRKAQMPAGEAVIDINATFGGVEIRVPETWRVSVKGMGIFGGFEDKTVPPRPVEGAPPPPHLVVSGYAVFGGASVKN
jgi:predicted membrane protein